LAQTETIQNSEEYENISTLVSEIEERLEDLEFAVVHKNMDFSNLKSDIWVIKADIGGLEDKLQVMIDSKSFFGL